MGTKIEGVYRWARTTLRDCKISLDKQGAGFRFSVRAPDGEVIFEHMGESQDNPAAVTSWLLDEIARRERAANLHIADPAAPVEPLPTRNSPAETALRRRSVEVLMSRGLTDADQIVDEIADEMGREYARSTIQKDMREVIAKWKDEDEANRPGLLARHRRRLYALAEKMEREAGVEPKVWGPLVKLEELIAKMEGTIAPKTVRHESTKGGRFDGWSREEKRRFAEKGEIPARVRNERNATTETEAGKRETGRTLH
jgi:hypothetical protein